MIASLLLLALPIMGCDNEPASEALVAEAPAPVEPEHTEPAPAEAAQPGEWTHYGSDFTLTEALTAAELLSAPEKFVDQNVLVEGKVTDVCQKAGCWMVITDDETTMRVLMKEHGFAVDKGGTGATCRVEGTIVAREIDPEFVAHLESESTNVEAMPEKNAEGNIVYELNASGVSMMKAEG